MPLSLSQRFCLPHLQWSVVLPALSQRYSTNKKNNGSNNSKSQHLILSYIVSDESMALNYDHGQVQWYETTAFSSQGNHKQRETGSLIWTPNFTLILRVHKLSQYLLDSNQSESSAIYMHSRMIIIVSWGNTHLTPSVSWTVIHKPFTYRQPYVMCVMVPWPAAHFCHLHLLDAGHLVFCIPFAQNLTINQFSFR